MRAINNKSMRVSLTVMSYRDLKVSGVDWSFPWRCFSITNSGDFYLSLTYRDWSGHTLMTKKITVNTGTKSVVFDCNRLYDLFDVSRMDYSILLTALDSYTKKTIFKRTSKQFVNELLAAWGTPFAFSPYSSVKLDLWFVTKKWNTNIYDENKLYWDWYS